MLRKISVFILLSTVFSLVTYGQVVEVRPESGEGKNRVFSFAFGGGSYLGIEIKEVTKENFSELGLSEVKGVSVTKVLENSPAEKAGLKAGDIIVAFDGQSVTSTKKLTRLIGEVAPDHTVDVTVIRGGSEIRLPVTVGKRDMPGWSDGNFVFPVIPDVPFPPDAPDALIAPDAPDAPDAPLAPRIEMPNIQIFPPDGKGFVWSTGPRRTIGVGVSSLSRQLGDYFGAEDGEGILITSVEADSPAARAGLKAGDVIIEANGKAVKGSGDLVRTLNEEKEGDITLTILRDKSRKTITVTPEESKGPEKFFQRIGPNGLGEGDRLKGRIRVAPKPEAPARPLMVQPGTRILR
jgi:serine protease Do